MDSSLCGKPAFRWDAEGGMALAVSGVTDVSGYRELYLWKETSKEGIPNFLKIVSAIRGLSLH